jgi:hypothetical protein
MVNVVIPIKHFEVQDVRPVEGQYHVNATPFGDQFPGNSTKFSLSSSAQRNWSDSKAFARMLKAPLRVERSCSLMRSKSNLTRSLRNVGLRVSQMLSSSRSRIAYVQKL